MKKIIALLAGAVMANPAHAELAPPPEIFRSEIVRVEPGDTARVERHGICRMVRNSFGSAYLVPSRTPQEWMNFTGSFLMNTDDMRGVSVSTCPKRLDNGCFLWMTGLTPSNRTERISFSDPNNSSIRFNLNSIRITDTSHTFTNSATGALGGSELVGDGDYPNISAAFPRSVGGTIDGFAIGAGTTVTLYTQNGFKGGPAMIFEGPVVVRNLNTVANPETVRFDPYATRSWSGDAADPGVFNQFPPSRRVYATTSMLKIPEASMPVNSVLDKWILLNSAFKNGSVKVSCE